MAYTPTEWETGDVITAAKLNNIEDGIVANEGAIADAFVAPEVTAADQGKVLTVDSSGEWEAAYIKNVFILHAELVVDQTFAISSFDVTERIPADLPEYGTGFMHIDAYMGETYVGKMYVKLVQASGSAPDTLAGVIFSDQFQLGQNAFTVKVIGTVGDDHDSWLPTITPVT